MRWLLGNAWFSELGAPFTKQFRQIFKPWVDLIKIWAHGIKIHGAK
jgi:hypothetical protein